MRSRAQLLTIDFAIGLLICAVVLSSIVFFFPRSEAPFRDDTERVNLFMTEGVPANWNNTSVIVPGFLSNGRFNETKIASFATLSVRDQKKILGITSDFTIAFTANNTTLPLCTTCGTTPTSYTELLPIKRTALLNSTITVMEVRLYR